MRVCGIDPGLQRTGYGVLDIHDGRHTLVDAGIIRSTASAPLDVRLHEISQDLAEILTEFNPQLLAVENVYSHYKHPQTAVLMGHVRGVVLLAAATGAIMVRQVAATAVKRALTGNGRASKSQMQQAIKLQLGLGFVPEPHDIADALAIAMCAVRDFESAVEVERGVR